VRFLKYHEGSSLKIDGPEMQGIFFGVMNLGVMRLNRPNKVSRGRMYLIFRKSMGQTRWGNILEL
jgi:hypothetical protein